MMQLYASVAKLRSSGSPFFSPAWKPLGGCERPLPRIVHGGSSFKSAGTPKLAAFISPIGCDCTVSYVVGLSLEPSGTTPVLTYRQSAMINLRASATIIGLRDPRAFSVRFLYQTTRSLSGWNCSIRHDNWISILRTRPLPERESPFSRRFDPLSSGEPVTPAL